MGNVILIGYRGTGKSSVAELVAVSTDRQVLHMDDSIVERTGCSISAFVAAHGWARFRDLESEVVREAASMSNTVVDTGGGVILREENVEQLKSTGPVFWLRAHATTIKARIQESVDRPSLTGQKSFLDEVEEVLKLREPLYASYADYTVETDNRTLGEIAEDIINILCTG